MILLFSTTPTAKPAKSYLPPSYIFGISAVSPPTNEQPECLQPSATPIITFSATSTDNLPQEK